MTDTVDMQDKAVPQPLLEVTGLVKHYPIDPSIFGRLTRRNQAFVRAVDGIDFSIRRGETFALVGESGCGKTTTGRCVLYLQEPTAGILRFDGSEIDGSDEGEMRRRRRQMQIIFQDPGSSLNPRMTIGQTIEEVLAFHKMTPRTDRGERVNDLLHTVGLDARMRSRFPNELSGGQRQRVGIARALAVEPSLVVADEPVSALDVSVQAQILQLLEQLKSDFGLAYLFISHDLGVVRHVADHVAVMYLGKIVERAPKAQLFAQPLHPYTKSLLSAVPAPNPRMRKQRIILSGDPPGPINPPSGCRFRTRCQFAQETCAELEPPLRELEPGHFVACHFAEELA